MEIKIDQGIEGSRTVIGKVKAFFLPYTVITVRSRTRNDPVHVHGEKARRKNRKSEKSNSATSKLVFIFLEIYNGKNGKLFKSTGS